MASTELKYGTTNYFFEYDESRFASLSPALAPAPLSDLEIGGKLDSPIGSAGLEEFAAGSEKVLIAVPDATRQAACGQIVNLLLRRLIAAGIEPFNITIIFSTGIHRRATLEEKAAILTPFVVQRVKTIDHAPRDLAGLVRLGETSDGIPVELNRALVENDLVILVGGVTFHYFAGFTGGRKLVCPGLASSKTIAATHRLAFDCITRSRASGVGTGLLDGNPVHEAFVDAASKVNIGFSVNSIVNDNGELVDLYCGDWLLSHRSACETFGRDHTIEIGEKRDLVIASCGGSPYDINLIQAHKTIEAASHACREGGTIVVLAECRDGLGRDDFNRWFEVPDSSSLAAKLCDGYQVNGQTAWSLLTKAERFDIRLVSGISPAKVKSMRMKPFESLAAALKDAPASAGYVIPAGSKVRFVQKT